MSVNKKKVVKKAKKNVPSGVVHIQSTFNNTIVTITDPAGNTVAWSSAGVKGFKGSRKSTPFAAQLVAEDAARKAIDHGKNRRCRHQGAGRGPGVRSSCCAGRWPEGHDDRGRNPHSS